MSEKQYEECVFQEATHVAVNGVVFQIAGNIWKSDQSYLLCWLKEDISIPLEYFSTFGIKPLREKKRVPIEFEATFVNYDGEWHRLFSLHGLKHVGCREAKFRCVQILEDEK